MESHENSCNSLPYIDDISIENETNPCQYNLKIIENYRDKNRNIEITNRFPDDEIKSLRPVAPLADETEFSDNKLSDSPTEVDRDDVKKLKAKESGVKLVIKGWNSTISIQGLDNESSITFNRRLCEVNKKIKRNEKRKSKSASEETISMEKSRKGKWKMLTKSIMLAKSARFERRALDERYPKYVLLKNEEDEFVKLNEKYPKMYTFNEKSSKPKRNSESKSEFSFKKSFKNKTEPIIPLEEILAKTNAAQPYQSKSKSKETVKRPLNERNTKIENETFVRRIKNVTREKKEGPLKDSNITGCSVSNGQIYNEIQGIFEDTLKLLPQGVDVKQSKEDQMEPQKRIEYCTSMPPQFNHFSPHDPYCCRPPKYIPVYAPHQGHTYENSNPQTKICQNKEITTGERNANDEEIDLENLPFGILSSFFPRVVIMNTIRSDDPRSEDESGFRPKTGEYIKRTNASLKSEERNFLLLGGPEYVEREVDPRATESLEVPKQDLTLKSKTIQEVAKPGIEDFFPFDASPKRFSSLEEDQKTKSQESEETEYLQYSESDHRENESIERNNPTPPPQYEIREKENENLSPGDKFKIQDVGENSENLSLTKIGYKMYDNLTKLSLNHEKKLTKKPEAKGCGCNGNGTKKSPYNITLESNNGVVKVTVPENELNFRIINSDRGDIQIGVMSGRKEKEEGEKKIVRREELWHSDDGGRIPFVLRSEKSSKMERSSKAFQTFKVSLADRNEVILSIETKEEMKKEEKTTESKSTKEMKVGTDDFDLAGGDFVCALDGNYKNLSPRIGQLLKHLHEKLETDERERKFLDEKINQKLIDQKFQGGILPKEGVFLIKHIGFGGSAVKKPDEVSPIGNLKKEIEKCEIEKGRGGEGGRLREYYCEECLATMRIFEDENPSVKSMVDKFETIIQLENY